MKHLLIIFTLITTMGFAQNPAESAIDSILLKYLLDKNPTKFNENITEAEVLYEESYDPWETRHSMLILDEKKAGVNKILRPLNSVIFSKYLPNTHFYYCERACNLEYNSGKLKTIYAIINRDTSSIGMLEPLDYTHSTKRYINIFQSAVLTEQNKKEEYCKAISEMFLLLRSEAFIFQRKEEQISMIGIWTSNTYKLTIIVEKSPYYLNFTFADNRLETINRKRK